MFVCFVPLGRFGEQHPFSGKAKPKNVTVNFVSRKGAMQLSWGGKSGVPLETIFGVTKGIKTDVRDTSKMGDKSSERSRRQSDDTLLKFIKCWYLL